MISSFEILEDVHNYTSKEIKHRIQYKFFDMNTQLFTLS
jgi:hypothetical protein